MNLVFLFSSVNFCEIKAISCIPLRLPSIFKETSSSRPKINGSKRDGTKITLTKFIHLVLHRLYHSLFPNEGQPLRNAICKITVYIMNWFGWYCSHMCDSITADMGNEKGRAWNMNTRMVVGRWKGSDNIIFHIDAFWWKHQTKRDNRNENKMMKN